MKTPKRFILGTKQYTVVQKRSTPARGAVGHVVPSEGRIYLRTVFDRKPATEEFRNAVFWHEAVHAILHDMKHPQWNDEIFVDGISDRLVQIFTTAEF